MCVADLAQRLGCRVHDKRLGAAAGRIEAKLTPRGRGFEIEVDPTPVGGWQDPECEAVARRRRRFRIAHELGHTLFYGEGPDGRRTRNTPISEKEERFCDAFAAALLLPRSAVAKCNPTAEQIFCLADSFDVSVELAARRMTEVHRCQTALWYWEAHRPAELYRQWSSHAGSLQRWRSSPLVEAAAVDGAAEGPVPALRDAGEIRASAFSSAETRQLALLAA